MDVIGFKLYLPHTPGDIFGSITVRPKKHRIPVKLVLYATAISTMNKSSLSMDCSLSDTEVIRRHGCRWSVECCCKVCKSLLKSGKEFRPVNDNATVSSTALVFTRLIILVKGLIDLIFKNNLGVYQNEKGCYVLFKKRKVLIQWKSGCGCKSV